MVAYMTSGVHCALGPSPPPRLLGSGYSPSSCRDDETRWGRRAPEFRPGGFQHRRCLPPVAPSLQPPPALLVPGCGSRRLRSVSAQSRRGRPSPSAPPSGRREGSPGRARAGGGGVPAIKRGRLPRRPGRLGPRAVGRAGTGRNSGRAG